MKTRKGRRRSRRRSSTRKKKTFTEQDYNSGDGMLTSVWGPGLWHYLHTMSFNYPVHPTSEQKKQYKAFLMGLQHVLPCRHCRENLKKNLRYAPLRACDLDSREGVSRYVFNLHETVTDSWGRNLASRTMRSEIDMRTSGRAVRRTSLVCSRGRLLSERRDAPFHFTAKKQRV